MSAERGDERDPREGLCAALSGGDWDTGAPAESARRAAACARGRMRRRRTMTAAGGLVVMAAVAAGAFWMTGGGERGAVAAVVGSREPYVAAFVAEPVRQKLPTALIPGRGQPFELNDEEALELLRGRPLMILPQADGTRKIVLLDGREAKRDGVSRGVAPAS